MASVAPDRSYLKIVHSLGPGKLPEVALSLVHLRGRIDVPVSVIRGIEARSEHVFVGANGPFSSATPHVEIKFTPAISAQLYMLTRQIVGESLETVVGGETICKAIVREPLGRHGYIWISASDFDEARALAERLRERWSKIGLCLVSRDEPVRCYSYHNLDFPSASIRDFHGLATLRNSVDVRRHRGRPQQ